MSVFPRPHNLSLCLQSPRTEICLTAVEFYNILLHKEMDSFHVISVSKQLLEDWKLCRKVEEHPKK